MDEKKILNRFDELIQEGTILRTKLKFDPIKTNLPVLRHNRHYYRRGEKWKSNCIIFLLRIFGEGSYYYLQFNSKINMKYRNASRYCKENVQSALGILQSAKENLEKGFLEDIFYEREIILFKDLLDQAYEFLKKNLDLGALAYGRIVLESTIKEFAKTKNCLKNSFNKTIEELKIKGVIKQTFEDSLRLNYRIGSSFHNLDEFQNLDKKRIKFFLDFVRDSVLNIK